MTKSLLGVDLPTTLSELLKLALVEAKKGGAQLRFRLYYTDQYLVGIWLPALMAGILTNEIAEVSNMSSLPRQVQKLVVCIDKLRQGLIFEAHSALMHQGIVDIFRDPVTEGQFLAMKVIKDFVINAVKERMDPLEAYETVAQKLEEAGL